MIKEPIIVGRTAVPGEATGRVRVISTSLDAHLVAEGDILVTPMTDPDMVPAMQRAAAVVTDRGGMLCHAAIICRELGKPCIVGTVKGTVILQNDSRAFVSAAIGSGAVYIES